MVLSSLNCPLTVEGNTLGSPVSFGLPQAGGPLRLTYRCGSTRGTITEGTTQREVTWEPPVALAAEYPALQRIPVEVILELLRGDQAVERRSHWLLLGLPEWVQPQGTLTVTDGTEAKNLCGSFVRGYSRAVVRVAAQGSAGAEIRDCRIACGPLTGRGTEVSFDLPQIGNQTVTARITDSRGRQLALTTTVRVLARVRPQGAVLTARPCDASGAEDPKGTYLKVQAIGSVTALPNCTPAFTLRGTDSAGAEQSWDLGTETKLDTALVIPKVTGLSLTVSDGLESLVFPYAPQPLLDMDIPGRALGIGCRGDRTGTVSLGLPVEMGGSRLTGLCDAESPRDALPLGQAEKRFLEMAPVWENPSTNEAYPGGTVPVTGELFLVEGAVKPGGAHFWELLGGSGCLRGIDGTATAVRPVEKTEAGLVFGPAVPEDGAVPLRIYRLLPGKEEP